MQLSFLPEPRTTVDVPPPTWFRAPDGLITSAYYMGRGQPLRAAAGGSAARTAGLRFEAKAHRRMEDAATRTGLSYIPAPRFGFTDARGRRTVIPDGLIPLMDKRAILVEIKGRHTADAWWQMMKLYVPVLLATEQFTEVLPLEFVGSYDPAAPFPVEHEVLLDLEQYLLAPQSGFKVLVWTA